MLLYLSNKKNGKKLQKIKNCQMHPQQLILLAVLPIVRLASNQNVTRMRKMMMVLSGRRLQLEVCVWPFNMIRSKFESLKV